MLGACSGATPAPQSAGTSQAASAAAAAAATSRTSTGARPPPPASSPPRPGRRPSSAPNGPDPARTPPGNAADGTKLADREDRRHLWLVPPDGTDLHEGSRPAGRWGEASSKTRDLPTGRRTGVISSSARRPIPPCCSRPTPTGARSFRLLSTECTGSPQPCLEFFPSYSPDGKRVAFVRLTESPDRNRGSSGSGIWPAARPPSWSRPARDRPTSNSVRHRGRPTDDNLSISSARQRRARGAVGIE